MGLSVSRNITLVFVFDKRDRHQNSDIVSEDSKEEKDEEVKDGEIFVSENKPSMARSWFRVKFIPRVQKKTEGTLLNPFVFLRSDHGTKMEQKIPC